MGIYKYYATIDLNKEPIKQVKAYSKEAAIIFFSSCKKLPVDEFTKIFTVESIHTTKT